MTDSGQGMQSTSLLRRNDCEISLECGYSFKVSFLRSFEFLNDPFLLAKFLSHFCVLPFKPRGEGTVFGMGTLETLTVFKLIGLEVLQLKLTVSTCKPWSGNTNRTLLRKPASMILT